MFYHARVSQLEPRLAGVELVEEPCRSALNPVRGMAFKWSINPYMGCQHRCAFCYVRAFEKRADRASGDGYGRRVRVKTNIAEVLRREFGRRSWRGELVVIGPATDAYQPAEGRFRLTRACLEAFRDFANPASIITRGPMIVRDLDVLTDLARCAELSVTFSVPTLDEEVWRRTEPGTAPPRQRLRAVETLVAAGIKTGVGMAPILPGISDRPEQLEAVVSAARAAGATGVWANVLYLRPGTREHFLGVLERHWPELVPRYGQLYAKGAYLPDSVTSPVRAIVAGFAARHQIADRRPVRLHPPPLAAERPRPVQLSLLAG